MVYTPEYRRRVVRQLRAGPWTAKQLAGRLRLEHGRGPSEHTIKRWDERQDAERAAELLGAPSPQRLRRALAFSGPVTPDHLDAALTLLGWDDSEACDRLAALTPAQVEGWRTGADAIPAHVAAHVRTLVDCLAGKKPRVRGAAPGGVGRKALGAHSPGGAPRPHTTFKFG